MVSLLSRHTAHNARTCWKVTLAVGAKLQGVITQMAIEIQERHAVVQGIPLVQVSDRHFWFCWPELILHLIHFVLFQVLFLSLLAWIFILKTNFLCADELFILIAFPERVRDNIFLLDMGKQISPPYFSLGFVRHSSNPKCLLQKSAVRVRVEILLSWWF